MTSALPGVSFAQTFGRRPATVQFTTGQVTDVDDAGNVTVNLGGNDRAATRLLDTPVVVGDNVLVARQGSTVIVLGPIAATTRPDTGVVASIPANSYTIVVTTTVGAVACQFTGSYTPTVGDTVLILWAGSTPIVIGAQGKTGAPGVLAPPGRPSTPPPPPARRITGTRTFTAGGCGTYRAGEWRDDANGNVIQGTAPGFPGTNTGAWFYGGAIRSTLRGARITSALVWLGRVSGGDYGQQRVQLYRITDEKRPNGALTFTANVEYVFLDIGEHGWYRFPIAMAQLLVDSGGALGVKAPSGPYMRLSGLAQTGNAGALRLSWSKSA